MLTIFWNIKIEQLIPIQQQSVQALDIALSEETTVNLHVSYVTSQQKLTFIKVPDSMRLHRTAKISQTISIDESTDCRSNYNFVIKKKIQFRILIDR